MNPFLQCLIQKIKKCFNKKEILTLIVVPHAPDKGTKYFKFSNCVISLLVIFNIIIFAFVCLFFFSYYSLNNKLHYKRLEYESLENAKELTEKELREYKEKEKEINDKMLVLRELESKLMNIIDYRNPITQSRQKQFKGLSSRGGAISPPKINTYTEIENRQSFEEMYDHIHKTATQIEGDIKKYSNTAAKAEIYSNALKSIPSVLPVHGQITSYFGYRKNPFGNGYEFHPAIDIANSHGTPIRASADGLVIEAGWSEGYGMLVRLNHQNGYESLYGHNSSLSVKVGQKVKMGQIIAYMGDTGRSTGTHCHYEVRLNGRPVNPIIENK